MKASLPVQPRLVCFCRGLTRAVASALLLALLLAGCSGKPPSQEPIRIAINVWPGYAHAFLAREKGFFARAGVDVELLLRQDISASRQLYQFGKADGLFDVLADVIMLNAAGIDTGIVCIADYSDTSEVIIGRPELQGLSDLKGRRVSFEGVNSFSHIFVLQALEHAGMHEYDVRLRNISAMHVLEALEQDRLDAGHTWEPITSAAVAQGYRVLAHARNVPAGIVDVLAFRADVLQQRPAAVRGIVHALFDARNYLHNNPEAALVIMSRALHISPEELRRGIAGVRQPGLQENVAAMQNPDGAGSLHRAGASIMQFYETRGQLSRRLDLKSIIQPRFVEALGRDAQ